MNEYDYDDPDIERGAVVREWRSAGFPASVPASLLDAMATEGVDRIDACRRVMGALATALDPELGRLLNAAGAEARDDNEVDQRNTAVHKYQRWILDQCLAHMTVDELLAARRTWKESIGDKDALEPDE